LEAARFSGQHARLDLVVHSAVPSDRTVSQGCRTEGTPKLQLLQRALRRRFQPDRTDDAPSSSWSSPPVVPEADGVFARDRRSQSRVHRPSIIATLSDSRGPQSRRFAEGRPQTAAEQRRCRTAQRSYCAARAGSCCARDASPRPVTTTMTTVRDRPYHLIDRRTTASIVSTKCM